VNFRWGLFLFLWFIPVSYPAGHDSLFFVLPKKSKQKKGAPEMAKDSLNLRNRAENGKTRCAQTVPVLFSARLRKFKAPSRAQRQKRKANPSRGWPLSFRPALRGFGL
jgi:hypothetical protein